MRIALLTLLVIFSVIDTYLYSKAPWPQRIRYRYFLPGGGVLAYLRWRK